MRVIVDEDLCLGCGICEGLAPDVFSLANEPFAEVLLDPVPEESERGRERWPGKSTAQGERLLRLPAPKPARGFVGSLLQGKEGPRRWRPTPVPGPTPGGARRWAATHKGPVDSLEGEWRARGIFPSSPPCPGGEGAPGASASWTVEWFRGIPNKNRKSR